VGQRHAPGAEAAPGTGKKEVTGMLAMKIIAVIITAAGFALGAADLIRTR
jgi:hypothetical protein